MHNLFLKAAALLGALAVALGAFGAHALKQRVSESAVDIFETGVRYQFYQVIALLAVGILFRDYGNKWMTWAGWLFIAGIILFSGSLYALTYIKAAEKTSYNWIGAITPLGGLAFIAGWIFMFIAISTQSRLHA